MERTIRTPKHTGKVSRKRVRNAVLSVKCKRLEKSNADLLEALQELLDDVATCSANPKTIEKAEAAIERAME